MAVPETASRAIARRRIVFTQVPRLVAESLGLALARRGFEIVVSPDGPVAGGCGPPLDQADPSHDVVEVVGLLGQDLSGWHRLTWDPPGRVGTVVLTDRCDVGLYLQAYRMGAATRDRRKVIEFFATEIALHREGRRFNQGDIRDPKFSNQDFVMAAEDCALS